MLEKKNKLRNKMTKHKSNNHGEMITGKKKKMVNNMDIPDDRINRSAKHLLN